MNCVSLCVCVWCMHVCMSTLLCGCMGRSALDIGLCSVNLRESGKTLKNSVRYKIGINTHWYRWVRLSF